MQRSSSSDVAGPLLCVVSERVGWVPEATLCVKPWRRVWLQLWAWLRCSEVASIEGSTGDEWPFWGIGEKEPERWNAGLALYPLRLFSLKCIACSWGLSPCMVPFPDLVSFQRRETGLKVYLTLFRVLRLPRSTNQRRGTNDTRQFSPELGRLGGVLGHGRV